MTLAAYAGHETLTFADYIDLATGRTLRAEPGGVYDIAPASGRAVDEIPAPWFAAVGGEAEAKLPLDAPEAAPEPPAWAGPGEETGSEEESP